MALTEAEGGVVLTTAACGQGNERAAAQRANGVWYARWVGPGYLHDTVPVDSRAVLNTEIFVKVSYHYYVF